MNHHHYRYRQPGPRVRLEAPRHYLGDEEEVPSPRDLALGVLATLFLAGPPVAFLWLVVL